MHDPFMVVCMCVMSSSFAAWEDDAGRGGAGSWKKQRKWKREGEEGSREEAVCAGGSEHDSAPAVALAGALPA